jgi:hypothetical protein
MASPSIAIEVSSSNGYVFTGSSNQDVIIYPSIESMDIMIGTKSNAGPSLAISSSNIQFNVQPTINTGSFTFVAGNSNFLAGLYGNGNFGLGTNNPTSRLDVNGDINFNGTLRSNGQPYVGSQWSNSSNRVFITGSNVGIGTNNPSFLLDVNGDINFNGTLRSNGQPYVGSQWSNSSNRVFITGSNVGIGTNNPSFLLDVNGDINFNGTLRSNGQPYVGSQWSNSSNMVFITGSNIGIGNSNPSRLLHVSGDVQIDSNLVMRNAQITSQGLLISKRPSGGTPSTISTIVTQVPGYTWNSNITLAAAGPCNITISSTTRVNASLGVNTTPAFALDVNGDINFANGTFRSNGQPFQSSQWSNTTSPATVFILQSNVGVNTNGAPSSLTVNPQVVDANNFNHSNAPMTITQQTATSTTVLSDPQPIIHLARQGTTGQALGARATMCLSRYENNGTNSRTQLDFQLAHDQYDTVNTMSIRSDGNVGVGTTTPLRTFDVNGRSKFRNILDTNNQVNNCVISLFDSGATSTSTNYIGLGVNIDVMRYNVRGVNDTHVFFANTTELMRIRGSGNVGIGSNPNSRLHLSGNAQSNQLTLSVADGGTDNKHWVFGPSNSNFFGYIQNDSFGSATNWIQCTRTGTTITNVAFPNGNVGIGTNNPSFLLDVNGTIRANSTNAGNNKIVVVWDGASGDAVASACNFMGFGVNSLVFRYQAPATNSHVFFTGTSATMLVGSNVGIGTITPSSTLHVAGTSRFTNNVTMDSKMEMTNNVSFAPPAIGVLGGTGDRCVLSAGTASAHPYSLGINGGTLWYSVPSGAVHNWFVAGTSQMSLSSSGLGLNGGVDTLVLRGGGNPINMSLSNNGGKADIGLAADIDQYMLGNSAGDMVIRNMISSGRIHLLGGGNTGAALTINNNNYVGIGTISPLYPLHVTATITATPPIPYGWLAPNGTTGQTTGTPGSHPISIFATGRILANEFNALSDQRIKKNIVEFEDILCADIVTKIHQKHYTKIGEARPSLGFIAQEMGMVFPNCVNVLPGSNNEYNIENLHMIDYDQLISVLWGAHRYQTRKLSALEDKLECLSTFISSKYPEFSWKT